MIKIPRFKRHLTVEVIEPDQVVFSSEGERSILRGRLFAIVAPEIDGQRTVDEIAARLEGTVTTGDIQFGLYCLQEKGCLADSSQTPPIEMEALAGLSSVSAELARQRLQETRVSVKSSDHFALDVLTRTLRDQGVSVGDGGQVSVVLADDYLADDLRMHSADSLQSGRPWILLKPRGRFIWWGPLFHPSRTGCWSCLAIRLRANLWGGQPVQGERSRLIQKGRAQPTAPCLVEAALNLGAFYLLSWIVKPESSPVEGQILALDTRSMCMSEHRLVRLPSCPQCGLEKPRRTSPIQFQCGAESGRPAKDCNLSPEETFEKLKHHISPVTGITSLKALYEAEDASIYVYGARSPLAGIGRRWRTAGPDLDSWCAGSGPSRIRARTSALCEALERYSGIFQGNERREKASYRSLGETAIHPNLCMGFSENQYQQRESRQQDQSSRSWVPEPFDEAAEIEWTPVWSLTGGSRRFVPTAYCYYGYPQGQGKRFCVSDSSGSACGSSREEAILHGFLELVERDAAALWWYNRIPRPGVHMEAFDDPCLLSVLRHYFSLERRIEVLDITSDLGIPTFVAVSSQDRDLRNVTVGFGAHFDAKVAIGHALSEMSQMLPAVLSGATTRQVLGFGKRVSEAEWLRPATELPLRTAHDFPEPPGPTLPAALQRCLEIVDRKGLDIVVLDQTRLETGTFVVKVLVPSLRPWWPRFAPGRLYDVPVRMGWLQKPLQERDLNPAHLAL